MGYYTYHRLRIETDLPNPEELLETIIEEESKWSDIKYTVGGDGLSGDSAKWYDHEEDMRKISLKWPDVTFHLSGQGEENDDIWEDTYRDGKCHARKAKIEIEDFSSNKLE